MANTHSLAVAEASKQYASNSSVNWGSGTSWSASLWVYNTSGSNGFRRFFGNNNGVLATNDIILRESDTGNIQLLVNLGAGSAQSSGVTWKDGWHWLGIISDGSHTKVYIDDNSTAIIDVAAVSTPFDGIFLGGYYQPSDNEYFEGKIDDVRIYDTNLSLANLAAQKSEELVGNESNLVAYWKLNNSASDSGPNGYTLTLTGSPSYSTSVPFVGSVSISVNDAITVAESVTLEVMLEPNVNDAITVAEAVTMDFVLDVSVSEAITVSESITVENTMLGDVSVNDAITVAEAVTIENTMLGDISVGEDITVSESVEAGPAPIDLSVYEEITVSESVEINMNLGDVSVNDAITVTDVVTTPVLSEPTRGIVHMRSKQQTYPLPMDNSEIF